MNKGTIYYDESSRGTAYPRPRGRWVGERIDNGKRVRMRSTNYDKVLKWITGDARECNRIELKGLPGYSIDVERKEVFGKRGMLKGIMNSAGQRQYELFPDGKPVRDPSLLETMKQLMYRQSTPCRGKIMTRKYII